MPKTDSLKPKQKDAIHETQAGGKLRIYEMGRSIRCIGHIPILWRMASCSGRNQPLAMFVDLGCDGRLMPGAKAMPPNKAAELGMRRTSDRAAKAGRRRRLFSDYASPPTVRYRASRYYKRGRPEPHRQFSIAQMWGARGATVHALQLSALTGPLPGRFRRSEFYRTFAGKSDPSIFITVGRMGSDAANQLGAGIYDMQNAARTLRRSVVSRPTSLLTKAATLSRRMGFPPRGRPDLTPRDAVGTLDLGARRPLGSWGRIPIRTSGEAK